MPRKLLLTCALAASLAPTFADAAPPQAPKAAGGTWIGRWYFGGTASVCRARPERGRGGEQGLRVFTSTMAYGYDSRCAIKKVTPRGAGVDVVQSCRGEGEEWTDTEYLEVVDGKLKLTVVVEGKRTTQIFNRCPAS
jgi:hypothetical protein